MAAPPPPPARRGSATILTPGRDMRSVLPMPKDLMRTSQMPEVRSVTPVMPPTPPQQRSGAPSRSTIADRGPTPLAVRGPSPAPAVVASTLGDALPVTVHSSLSSSLFSASHCISSKRISAECRPGRSRGSKRIRTQIRPIPSSLATPLRRRPLPAAMPLRWLLRGSYVLLPRHQWVISTWCGRRHRNIC
jgi:hypothetical protein